MCYAVITKCHEKGDEHERICKNCEEHQHGVVRCLLVFCVTRIAGYRFQNDGSAVNDEAFVFLPARDRGGADRFRDLCLFPPR